MSEEKTLEELREENRKLKEENEQLNKSMGLSQNNRFLSYMISIFSDIGHIL